MTHIIAPRREESLFQKDKASLRLIKYMEDVSENANETSADVATNAANIATNTTNIATNTTNIAQNTTDIATINTELGDLTVITTGYTTTGAARILCNGTLTVTLRASPGDDEKVYIKRVAGPVTIDGNGHTIDGESSIIINKQYTTLLLVFSSTLNEWYIL